MVATVTTTSLLDSRPFWRHSHWSI